MTRSSMDATQVEIPRPTPISQRPERKVLDAENDVAMLRELVRRVEKEALAIAEEKNEEITELRRVEDEKFAMEGTLEMARAQIADLRARTQTQQQEMVYLNQKLEIANSALKVQSAEQL